MITDTKILTEINNRRKYFSIHFPAIEDCGDNDSITLPNSCPACGYNTLDSRWGWEICTICFWEDDGQDNHNADTVLGGPNHSYSLNGYRAKIYTWMQRLKSGAYELSENELRAGAALNELDNFIQNNEQDVSIVVNQINTVCALVKDLRKTLA